VASNVGFYAANGVTMVFLAVLLNERGLDAAQIGTIVGLSYLVRVVAAPLWGQLADRLGRVRLVMVICCALAGLPMLVLLSIHGFWLAAVLVLLSNAGSSALAPLSDTITWRNAERHGFSFGPVRAAGSAAYVLGTFGGGMVVQALGGASVAWMIAICYAATMALLPAVQPVHVPAPPQTRAKMFAPLFAIAPFRRLLLISAMLQGAHAAYYGLSTLYWRSQGVSDRMIGLLWSEGVVAEILVMVLLRRWVARIEPGMLMRVGACGAIIRWIGTGLTADPLWLAVLQPLHAASFTLPYLASLRIIATCTPRHLAATAQSVQAALGFAAPTGLLMALASALYPQWSGAVFFLMAGLCVAALPLVWRQDTAP